jgi:hypothetical protein
MPARLDQHLDAVEHPLQAELEVRVGVLNRASKTPALSTRDNAGSRCGSTILRSR